MTQETSHQTEDTQIVKSRGAASRESGQDVDGEQSLYKVALEQLDYVAKLIDLDPGIHEILKYPKRELTVNFPVRMDDGS